MFQELLHSISSETHGVPHGVNKDTSESRELVMVMVSVVFKMMLHLLIDKLK